MKNLPKNQPLLIRRGGTKDLSSFYMPDKQGVIHVRQNEEVLVACPGRDNQIKKLAIAETVVTCQGNEYFTRSGKQFTIEDFNCSSLVSHSARRNTNEKCEIPGELTVIDIGFELPDKSFYTLMKTCFDEKTSDAVYAKFIQTPSIAAAQHGEPRPTFIEGDFYPDIKVNSMYVKDGQRNSISRILGSNELAVKYIGEGDYYLARGHLTARADYVFSSHQRATFWYVNVAPQWQTFNGGNWNFLESSVRGFTGRQDQDIVIYTGTHGIATLPDVNNVQKPLYLYVDDNNIGKIKVPELFWKVLYEPMTQRGLAFVGINNPYLTTYTPLCKNVCDQIDWLSWQPTKQKLGFGYCCDVNELRKTIKTIPKLKVVELLV